MQRPPASGFFGIKDERPIDLDPIPITQDCFWMATITEDADTREGPVYLWEDAFKTAFANGIRDAGTLRKLQLARPDNAA